MRFVAADGRQEGAVMGLFDGIFDGEATGDPEIDEMLSGLQKLQSAAAESAQRIAIETADATSPNGLARVWVNAQGVVIQAEFDERRFPEATAAEVADAVVRAAQAAAAKVHEKTEALQAGLFQQASALGAFGSSDLRPLDELQQYKQLHPTVSLSAPDSRERRAARAELDAEPDAAGRDDGEWHFTIADRG
ncbi:YbaB/EbfC family nucleoid-associated protein [Mycobacterium vicinigordonae]|uniref:YbaB/EbfC family nucleoid-associated protein n=1 Tax=Mycobacterium vicinigordonae TaxID=1719132 RepID=A0A7D6DW78_9MYCO|nr:YbaB/EbfC family nucleoid-associated protein [Mycobacterium vicinigordonae]QLL06008.1 YbaB/EbfC family nucleoid-associated protein [Mycobacterium vicinigordonae]